MNDENQGAIALIRLANQFRLDARDYERLAMAVFGEMIAKDAARAQEWKRDNSRILAYFAYGDGKTALEKHKSLQPCWRRLRQDLFSGNRDAFVGVQMALAYAKAEGLLANPRWGGERRREVEKEFARKGWDPFAPIGMRAAPKPAGSPNSGPPSKFVSPDVSSTAIRRLPIHKQLGIGDMWIALSEEERIAVNGLLAGIDESERIQELEKMAGDLVFKRAGNNDIPASPDPDWMRNLPRQLAGKIDKLPPRSKAILEARYAGFGASGNRSTFDTEVNNLMVLSNGRVSGDELMQLMQSTLCSRRDSVGAQLRYEMQLEQGTMSFPAYLTLRARHAPKLAAKEREMATRHAKERLAERAAFRSGPAADQKMTASHRRLRAEAFLNDPVVVAAVKKSSGKLQPISGGVPYALYDEYYIIVDRMPNGVSPQAFVTLLASDLNRTVGDTTFDRINMFHRRVTGVPQAGEIVDIDIGGPDNGSVILSKLTPNYFIYTCINTSWGGEHPEYGSREFGVERMNDGRTKVYTRAVSSSANAMIGAVGPYPQQTGWSRLVKGIATTIEKRGGSVVDGSFQNSSWRVSK